MAEYRPLFLVNRFGNVWAPKGFARTYESPEEFCSDLPRSITQHYGKKGVFILEGAPFADSTWYHSTSLPELDYLGYVALKAADDLREVYGKLRRNIDEKLDAPAWLSILERVERPERDDAAVRLAFLTKGKDMLEWAEVEGDENWALAYAVLWGCWQAGHDQALHVLAARLAENELIETDMAEQWVNRLRSAGVDGMRAIWHAYRVTPERFHEALHRPYRPLDLRHATAADLETTLQWRPKLIDRYMKFREENPDLMDLTMILKKTRATKLETRTALNKAAFYTDVRNLSDALHARHYLRRTTMVDEVVEFLIGRRCLEFGVIVDMPTDLLCQCAGGISETELPRFLPEVWDRFMRVRRGDATADLLGSYQADLVLVHYHVCGRLPEPLKLTRGAERSLVRTAHGMLMAESLDKNEAGFALDILVRLEQTFSAAELVRAVVADAPRKVYCAAFQAHPEVARQAAPDLKARLHSSTWISVEIDLESCLARV